MSALAESCVRKFEQIGLELVAAKQEIPHRVDIEYNANTGTYVASNHLMVNNMGLIATLRFYQRTSAEYKSRPTYESTERGPAIWMPAGILQIFPVSKIEEGEYVLGRNIYVGEQTDETHYIASSIRADKALDEIAHGTYDHDRILSTLNGLHEKIGATMLRDGHAL